MESKYMPVFGSSEHFCRNYRVRIVFNVQRELARANGINI
jgi:hypothetical protein